LLCPTSRSRRPAHPNLSLPPKITLAPRPTRLPFNPAPRVFSFPTIEADFDASPPRSVPRSPLNALPFQSAHRLSGNRKGAQSFLSFAHDIFDTIKMNTITYNNNTTITNCNHNRFLTTLTRHPSHPSSRTRANMHTTT
ncbi:hypothetical protein Hypma_003998, partial [Hypsizygus marmoreus]